MSKTVVHLLIDVAGWLYLLYVLYTGSVGVRSYVSSDGKVRRDREPGKYWAFVTMITGFLLLWTFFLIKEVG